MNHKTRLELIKRNAEEILNEQKISSLLKKKHPRVYCGYEVSGEVHLGHLVTMTKLLDLEKAGFHVVVLFADWHTWLNQKGDWEFIHNETKIWEKVFKEGGLKNAEFVLGSKFQRDLGYIDDVLFMSLKTTIVRALRSMQEVARDIERAKVSQVIYPFMQIEDIKALKLDCVVSGIDQRKIHAMGIELFNKENYSSPVFIHTPIIPSLKGKGKMSSSVKESLISLRDSEKEIKRKIGSAYCPIEINDNGVLAIFKLVIFPRYESIIIKRESEFGGDIIFDNYYDLERTFLAKQIHPKDLKDNLIHYLLDILKPIREAFGRK